jgi:acyl-CoA reductase-like NAD-dependent aldehyde dehydrogenase
MKRPRKNPAAVSLGALGGKARAKSMTPEERSAAAAVAAEAKWAEMTPEQRSEHMRRVRSGK